MAGDATVQSLFRSLSLMHPQLMAHMVATAAERQAALDILDKQQQAAACVRLHRLLHAMLAASMLLLLFKLWQKKVSQSSA